MDSLFDLSPGDYRTQILKSRSASQAEIDISWLEKLKHGEEVGPMLGLDKKFEKTTNDRIKRQDAQKKREDQEKKRKEEAKAVQCLDHDGDDSKDNEDDDVSFVPPKMRPSKGKTCFLEVPRNIMEIPGVSQAADRLGFSSG